MALKFEGGAIADEPVERLFVQSVNADSPASRALGDTLGHLQEGDELLRVHCRTVSKMTRLECVAALKGAPVAIQLMVRRDQFEGNFENFQNSKSWPNSKRWQSRSLKGRKGPPPPVPPRLASTTLTSVSGTLKASSVENVSWVGGGNNAPRAPKRRPSQPPPLSPIKLMNGHLNGEVINGFANGLDDDESINCANSEEKLIPELRCPAPPEKFLDSFNEKVSRV